jgi:hypothetical protein
VGETLALSASALYLREPLTQSWLAHSPGAQSILEVKPPTYSESAQNAFAGIPAFPASIVPEPRQWSLRRRLNRRVLIKEVNPLVIDWLVKKFAPKVVYLWRHPAAVADSFHRMGWQGPQFAASFSRETLEREVPQYGEFDSFWSESAAFQAFIHRWVLDRVAKSESFRLVRYEDLCADPIAGFRALYDFGGLQWDSAVEARIGQGTPRGAVDESPYSTKRNSTYEANKWRSDLSAEQRVEIERGWCEAGAPLHVDFW